MKVGIVTYHRSHNYGAMLQAYGLRRFLSDCGYDARLVDYWPEHQQAIYRLFSWREFGRSSLRGKARMLKRFLKTLPETLSRRRRFKAFFEKELLPYCAKSMDVFDTIVYGSDQIWRKQLRGGHFNPVYFGQNKFKSHHGISYAASMGTLPNNPEDAKTVLSLVKNLDAISVREDDLKAYLTGLGVTNVEWTTDPVFLLSPAVWSSLAGESPLVPGRYLLFYNLNPEAFRDDAVESFAKNCGMGTVRIGKRALPAWRRGCHGEFGPYEFLNLVKFSSFVVSSSYHGDCFSILFHKPFLTAFPRNPQRARSLLSKIGLQDRLIEPNQPSISEGTVIDWTIVDRQLSQFKDNSVAWLLKTLDMNPSLCLSK